MFDGRAVCYPTDRNLRDYLSWRQADTHINCQYNTCYWALVKSGKKPTEAQTILKGTQTDFKNELLFNTFGINYNNLPQQFRKVWSWKVVLLPHCLYSNKWNNVNWHVLNINASVLSLQGSVIIHSPKTIEKVKDDGTLIERKVMRLQIFHEDIIRDAFWNNNPHLLKWFEDLKLNTVRNVAQRLARLTLSIESPLNADRLPVQFSQLCCLWFLDS